MHFRRLWNGMLDWVRGQYTTILLMGKVIHPFQDLGYLGFYCKYWVTVINFRRDTRVVCYYLFHHLNSEFSFSDTGCPSRLESQINIQHIPLGVVYETWPIWREVHVPVSCATLKCFLEKYVATWLEFLRPGLPHFFTIFGEESKVRLREFIRYFNPSSKTG